MLRSIPTMGILSSNNVCLSPVYQEPGWEWCPGWGTQMCRAAMMTSSPRRCARQICPLVRGNGWMNRPSGWTDRLFCFHWASLQCLPIARSSAQPRCAARRLMTGAPQISSCMRAVFVSARWLPRTEVVETSPTRRRMELPSFKKGDEMWGCGINCESGDGGRSI